MVNRPGVAQTVFKTDLAQQSTIAVKLGILNNQWLNLLTILFYIDGFREDIRKKASFFWTFSKSGLEHPPPLILDILEATFVSAYFGQP